MTTTAKQFSGIRYGDIVEFESNYGPGTEVKTRRGRVMYVPDRFPGNIDVEGDAGQFSMLRSELRVVERPR